MAELSTCFRLGLGVLPNPNILDGMNNGWFIVQFNNSFLVLVSSNCCTFFHNLPFFYLAIFLTRPSSSISSRYPTTLSPAVHDPLRVLRPNLHLLFLAAIAAVFIYLKPSLQTNLPAVQFGRILHTYTTILKIQTSILLYSYYVFVILWEIKIYFPH